MEQDEDEREIDSPTAQEPGQDIVGDAQREDDLLGPDAPNGSDEPAESRAPVASLAPQEAHPSAEDPESPDAPEEVTAPSGAGAAQSGGQATRIELPAGLDISPAMQPPITTGDGHSHLLPLDRGAEGHPNPVDQIFPSAWRLPGDTGGSIHAPESAADGSPEGLGKPMPRVQVLVTLLESQTIYAEAIDEALEKQAPKYRQIAESEVERGFWHYENQRRAADWRLRGP